MAEVLRRRPRSPRRATSPAGRRDRSTSSARAAAAPGRRARRQPGDEAALRRPGQQREGRRAVHRRQRPGLRLDHPGLRPGATRTGPCNPAQQQVVNSRRQAAFSGVGKAIDEVRAVMAEAGYQRSQWRFIVQSYGSPVPRGGGPLQRARPAAVHGRRLSLLRRRPQLGARLARQPDLRRPAVRRGLQGRGVPRPAQPAAGREVCSTATRQPTLTEPPSGDERVGALSHAQPRPGRDPGDAAPQLLRPAGARALPHAGGRRRPGAARAAPRRGRARAGWSIRAEKVGPSPRRRP